MKEATPLGAAFASFGLLWGVWGVTFADFVSHRAISFGRAGSLLAVLSAVSIAVMVLVAQRLESVPRHLAVALAIVTFGLGVLLIAAIPDAWLLVAFAVTGVGTGLTDVFVNAAGQELESRREEPILQRLHASYSFGAAAGALLAGVGLAAGAHFAWLLGGAAAAQLASGAVNVLSPASAWRPAASPGAEGAKSARLPKADDVPAERAALSRKSPGRRARTSLSVFVAAPFLLVPGGALAAAYFVDGSLEVWAVVYLRESLGASPLIGATGLVAFNLAGGLGQLLAARLLFGLGYRRTLLLSGLTSLAAGTVAVLAGRPGVVSAALLVMGFCVAATAPAAIGMVGGAGVNPATGIAAMSTLGYAGYVFGPPLLGWLADGAGLRVAMAVVVVATAGIAAAGMLSRGPGAHRQAPG